MAKGPGAWSAAVATQRINASAASDDLTVHLTRHAKDQMLQRDLIMGDVLHLLRTGFVYDAPEPATREGLFKYRVEGSTPNSDGRTVRTVVIPDGGDVIKVVTVMWRDER